MFSEIGGLVALQLASAYSSGSANTDGNTTTPQLLLDRYVPGFGPLHTLIMTWTGIDITFIAGRIAMLFALYAGTRLVCQQIYAFLVAYCASTITIAPHDVLIKEVLSWMSSNVVAKRGSRLLAAQTVRAGDDGIVDPFLGYRDDSRDDGRSNSVRFYPAVGTHLFLFRGLPFVFELCSSNLNGREGMVQATTAQEAIILRCFGRNSEPLKSFLSHCKEFAKEQRQSMTTICSADEHSPSSHSPTATSLTR
jgi:chaperone BCS1